MGLRKLFKKEQPTLTVKGYYLMKYCKRIIDGEIPNPEDGTETFEEAIFNMAQSANFTREQMAKELYLSFSQLEYNEELKEALR